MGNSVSIPALPYIPHNKPPPTVFAIKCHPKADELCRELDSFFLKHWPFKDQKERNRFFASQTNRWACYSLPLVRDDRIIDSIKVNTLLFLLDDIAEDMTIEEGKQLYKRLIPIAMGNKQPNREDPLEWITYDTWASMRACDKGLADEVLQQALICVTAQVDEKRLLCANQGDVWRQRIKEGGCAFVAAVVRYGMDLHLSPQTLSSFSAIDESYGRLGIIVNDIHSFEKELRLWNEDHKEGAQLVNMVDTMAKDTGLSYEASKRVLWIWCREWELKHQDLVKERLAAKDGDREDLKIYLNGLEYVLGGNEYWSETTQRYHWKD